MNLEAKDIRKTYGSQVVLDDISFSLKKGEITGLLGVNGAGKSTLLKIISGINLPDRGEVNKLGLSIAYMSERNPLYPHMYVTEYLFWVASIKRVKDTQSKVEWVVKSAGLSEVLTKKISMLSKGYRQRVGLAATIIGDADVIILDEPISGLDPKQIKEYRSLIRTLASNKIVILSSHLMQEIEALCDTVYLLEDGQLRALDTHHTNTSDKYMIRLKLDRNIDSHVLESLEGVERIERLNQLSFILHITSSTDLSLLVFDQVTDQGARIQELTKVVESLDALFS